MKPRLTHIISLLSLIFLVACGRKKEAEISLYHVKKSDFVDAFSVSGFAEPIEVKKITAPRYGENQIVYLVKDATKVQKGDTICIFENNSLTSRYQKSIESQKAMEADLKKRKVQLASEYQLLVSQIESNKVDEKMYQFDSLALTFASPKQKKIQELEQQKNNIQRKLLQDKLKSLAIIQRTEIGQMQIRAQHSQNEVKRMKEKVNELVLKSPCAGTVLIGKWWNGEKLKVGAYPYTSMMVAQIPLTSKMKIKMQLSESDYKRVNMGDSVFFTFDAMPTVKGSGKIVQKSPMGESLYFNNKESAIKVFNVEASLEKSDSLPKPDFTTNCKIILDYARDTIVVPNIAVFHKDSIDVVFVKKKRGFEKREVKKGKSSSKETIIEKGLYKDEIIALAEPNKENILSTLLLHKKSEKKKTENRQNDKQKINRKNDEQKDSIVSKK